MKRIGLVIATITLFACSNSAPRAEDPYWGKQACAHCSMLVSEKAPAAQVLLENGARRYFDDIGCLVAWERREPHDVKHRWVRTPNDDGWTDANSALFSAGHRTPMDFGFLPDTAGLSWDELRTAIGNKQTRNP